MKELFRKKPISKILSDAEQTQARTHQLKKSLGVVDLTSLGIAAVIGAGIFATVGTSAAEGGPAVSLLFVFTAIACGFSAICYAQFASTIPVAGSAYTYAYASMGELIAWIIGWDLIMEYAIGNIAVAISWSDYFTALMSQYGLHVPEYFSMDFLSAQRGFEAATALLTQGIAESELINNGLSLWQYEGFQAYQTAPQFFGVPMVMDLPALFVNVLVTWVVYIGIRESKRVANFMVLLKVAVVLLVIVTGFFYVSPENWRPFAPNGLVGVLKGVSGVFFAYIGFDAISTTAEECTNPKRDLPLSMGLTLVICTILYVLISFVLTGIVPYTQLAVGDPLAYVFGPEGANVPWIAFVVSASAVVALFTVLLVFQLGQPRIWMVMGRDGLLPPIFSAIHPKFKTPWFSTLVTGFVVGIPCLFMNLTEVTDLTSIGTLFAFLVVCLGALVVDNSEAKFKVPYINGKWIFPFIFLGSVYFVFSTRPELSSFQNFSQTFVYYVYIVFLFALVVLTFLKNWSLIPLIGATTCSYLMTELGATNWIRFGGWLALGLVVYFFYGFKRSRLT